jgi:23S rRNA pseudouridine1911/1915/1917 synthase
VKNKLKFLYEDNHVLAVYKPAGMLSQGDLTGDLDLLTLAKEILKRRDNKLGNVYLGLVHRLDRPVAGVMIVAKTSKAAGRLSKQFRERSTKKIYRAVVEGRPEQDRATLTHRLQKDRANRLSRVVGLNEQGRDGVLSYRVLDSSADHSLIEVDLKTGLSHQIRVQLSTIGCPILGDRKYGSTMAGGSGTIALYARAITFHHPVKNEPMTIVAEPPPNWPWSD